MCVAPSCTTTEVILNNVLSILSSFYRWKVGSEEPKRPYNQETVGLGVVLVWGYKNSTEDRVIGGYILKRTHVLYAGMGFSSAVAEMKFQVALI